MHNFNEKKIPLNFNKTLIMGIINVTPDSFFQGSRVQTLENILRTADKMINEGADILDIGGESTRPNANEKTVTTQIELERVLPAIEEIKKRFNIPLSIDTSSAMVIRESAKLGIDLINDVRALNRDGALEAAAESQLPIILMHSLINHDKNNLKQGYKDITKTVCDYLLDRVNVCVNAGIDRETIILDPGFGGGMFGKNPAQNLSLLKNLKKLIELPYPILVGMSRKGFICSTINKTTDDSLYGSIAVDMIAAYMGANIIRVHNVSATKDAITMLNAVYKAK